LTAAGAVRGVEQPEYQELPAATVTDDQYRLFYAAFNGDVKLMKTLHILNWKVNSYDYDGRTALGIAASEGHVEAVKYLVVHGADPLHKDARGNDALADAKRENRGEAVEFLQSIIE
jgi:glutaminase